jgi:hypothetical protein
VANQMGNKPKIKYRNANFKSSCHTNTSIPHIRLLKGSW